MKVETQLLDDAIKNSGMKKTKIAEILGIALPTFSAKLHGKLSFKASEVYVLCDILNIRENQAEIFLP